MLYSTSDWGDKELIIAGITRELLTLVGWVMEKYSRGEILYLPLPALVRARAAFAPKAGSNF